MVQPQHIIDDAKEELLVYFKKKALAGQVEDYKGLLKYIYALIDRINAEMNPQ